MINKDTLKIIRADIDNALISVGEKHGLSLKIGSIKYSDESFDAKLVAQLAKIGDVSTEKALFERFCESYGFAKDDYLRTFQHKGQPYVLIGFKPSSPKYSLICKNTANGKPYGFPVGIVKELFSIKNIDKWYFDKKPYIPWGFLFF